MQYQAPKLFRVRGDEPIALEISPLRGLRQSRQGAKVKAPLIVRSDEDEDGMHRFLFIRKVDTVPAARQ